MYIFAKVVFTGVCLSTGGGVCPIAYWATSPGRYPPCRYPPCRHPLGRHPLGRHSPWADTPLGRHPFLSRHPQADTPRADTPGQTPPCPVHAGIHTPPLPSACWDTHPPVQCMLGYTPPCAVPAGIWSTSWHYASHWNAFSGGSKRGCEGCMPPPPPRHPNSFNFMQFLGNFGKIICWRPPRELAPPPRGNPGSTTGILVI